MQEWIIYLIGIAVLLLGFPIGHYLAKTTKEELKSGQPLFKLIILISFICAIVSAILRIDTLMFAFLFIVVVTSRSIRK